MGNHRNFAEILKTKVPNRHSSVRLWIVKIGEELLVAKIRFRRDLKPLSHSGLSNRCISAETNKALFF